MSAEIQSMPSPTLETGRIHQGDCIEWMRQIEAGTVDLVFADPPFNIGYKYDEYHDRHEDEVYLAWSKQWMEEVHRILKPSGTFWLAIGDEYAAELKVDAEHKLGFSTRSWVVWYYTFGVNCRRKFSRSHAHLFHFVKDENDFTFNAEDPQVRVPSARALVYGDKRANPAGRLPDDTWILRPQDLADGFQPEDDTWYYARVAGTFKERQGFHGCQMPEQLLGRIIRVSSNPGDIVLDPFAGSGTTLAVAKKLGRRWVGCELSEEYVRAATERLQSVKEEDALDGPADPIASAPSTANGRRLDSWAGEKVDIESADGGRDLTVATAARPAELGSAAESGTAPATSRRDVRSVIRDALVNAFYASHDGFSIDSLLAKPQLQAAFHEACVNAGLIGGPADWNRELLRLRKTGGFPRRGQVKRIRIADEELEAYSFAAEIAWRLTGERFGNSSLDEIFCDPEKTEFFDRTAKRFAPGFVASQYRWAALRLRKASRELVEEAKKYRFMFTKRDFSHFHAWARLKPSRLAGEPGIYLLRGEGKTPLLIGRAGDLGERLATHAECRALGSVVKHVAWLTGEELPGQQYLDAFKEDLIRRYAPKWNVNLVGLSGVA